MQAIYEAVNNEVKQNIVNTQHTRKTVKYFKCLIIIKFK